MIQDDNCMVIKGYISRCELFIGARTHATIAAYSTGVPTLVLGYSVKARGIAYRFVWNRGKLCNACTEYCIRKRNYKWILLA